MARTESAACQEEPQHPGDAEQSRSRRQYLFGDEDDRDGVGVRVGAELDSPAADVCPECHEAASTQRLQISSTFSRSSE